MSHSPSREDPAEATRVCTSGDEGSLVFDPNRLSGTSQNVAVPERRPVVDEAFVEAVRCSLDNAKYAKVAAFSLSSVQDAYSSRPSPGSVYVARQSLMSPLPFVPIDEGTDLNIPPRTYGEADVAHGTHLGTPGFRRNRQAAAASLMLAATREVDTLGSEGVGVISTASAVSQLFHSAMSDAEPVALQVCRIGPTLWVDGAFERPSATVSEGREASIASKALCRMKELALDMCEGTVATPTTIGPGVDMPQAHSYNHVLRWGMGTLNVILGVDTPIVLKDKMEMILRAHEMDSTAQHREDGASIDLGPQGALDAWFDATLSNIPNVGICLHKCGVVQEFHVKRVQELLSLVDGKLAAAAMTQSGRVLHWLVENCTKDAAQYVVIKNFATDKLELYECDPPRGRQRSSQDAAPQSGDPVDPSNFPKKEILSEAEESLLRSLASMCYCMAKHLIQGKDATSTSTSKECLQAQKEAQQIVKLTYRSLVLLLSLNLKPDDQQLDAVAELIEPSIRKYASSCVSCISPGGTLHCSFLQPDVISSKDKESHSDLHSPQNGDKVIASHFYAEESSDEEDVAPNQADFDRLKHSSEKEIYADVTTAFNGAFEWCNRFVATISGYDAKLVVASATSYLTLAGRCLDACATLRGNIAVWRTNSAMFQSSPRPSPARKETEGITCALVEIFLIAIRCLLDATRLYKSLESSAPVGENCRKVARRVPALSNTSLQHTISEFAIDIALISMIDPSQDLASRVSRMCLKLRESEHLIGNFNPQWQWLHDLCALPSDFTQLSVFIAKKHMTLPASERLSKKLALMHFLVGRFYTISDRLTKSLESLSKSLQLWQKSSTHGTAQISPYSCTVIVSDLHINPSMVQQFIGTAYRTMARHRECSARPVPSPPRPPASAAEAALRFVVAATASGNKDGAHRPMTPAEGDNWRTCIGTLRDAVASTTIYVDRGAQKDAKGTAEFILGEAQLQYAVRRNTTCLFEVLDGRLYEKDFMRDTLAYIGDGLDLLQRNRHAKRVGYSEELRVYSTAILAALSETRQTDRLPLVAWTTLASRTARRVASHIEELPVISTSSPSPAHGRIGTSAKFPKFEVLVLLGNLHMLVAITHLAVVVVLSKRGTIRDLDVLSEIHAMLTSIQKSLRMVEEHPQESATEEKVVKLSMGIVQEMCKAALTISTAVEHNTVIAALYRSTLALQVSPDVEIRTTPVEFAAIVAKGISEIDALRAI